MFEEKPVSIENSYVANYHKLIKNGGFFGQFHLNPVTQKAKGINYLQSKSFLIENMFDGFKVPKHYLFAAGTSFDDNCFNYPVFARPCPTVPRHGFVDSIVCKDGESLTSLSLLTKSIEENAEILITKPIRSHYNVILNGGVITFASGNDGATSGKGCHYFYISEDPIAKVLNLQDTDLIATDEVPFYEFVLDADYREGYESPVRLVQVRSAPSTPKVKDYVPNKVEVKNILKADGDLLAWESLLKTVDPSNTIIDHTSGSLSSHYAIHAIVNNIPIFTSYLPEIGSLIEPTVQDTEINEEDKTNFKNAFIRGFVSVPNWLNDLKFSNNDIAKMKGILVLALSTLHNYSEIAMTKDYGILGLVLGMFCRTCFAVSSGESRYVVGKPGAEKFNDFINKFSKDKSRNACYNYMMNLDYKDVIESIEIIFNIFYEIKWGGGYGGMKWASCTLSVVKLYNACVLGEITKVVELFNKVINEEHNGGKYLNKVISTSEFDHAANQPSQFTLKHLSTIVDILHTAWSKSVTPTENQLSKFVPINLKYKASAFKKNSDGNFVTSENKVIEILFLLPSVVSEKDSQVGVFKKFGFIFKNKSVELDLPTVVINPNFNADLSTCTCESCTNNKLYSAPYWLVDKYGTKIISKVKANKMFLDNGYSAIL